VEDGLEAVCIEVEEGRMERGLKVARGARAGWVLGSSVSIGREWPDYIGSGDIARPESIMEW